MDFISSVSWMPFLALTVTLIGFVVLKMLSSKLGWTPLIFIALLFGVGIGVLFQSEGNAWLRWVDFLGNVYVRLLILMVAPVILLSIISGFISLRGKGEARKVGLKSVFWLLFQAAVAVVLSITAAKLTGIGKGAGEVFAGIEGIDKSTVAAYEGLSRPFDEVLMNLLPQNIVTDIANGNVPAIIIGGIAIAAAYLAIAAKQGEEKVKAFSDFVNAAKHIVFKILDVIIDQTPYAVMCLIAVSASKLIGNWHSMLQLLALMALIYIVCIIHTWIAGGLIIRFAAKLNPFRFFKKIFHVQATAFTTQSSLGTLPVTVKALRDDVGVSEEVADFTASLGTTIGMPGCTCIWTVLLALFFVNATGMEWGALKMIQLALVAVLMSVGSAGVPGIAVVSAIGLFSVFGLPVGAVILMQPINTISDMIRTTDNVSTAAIAATVVARENGLIDDDVFNDKKEVVPQ